MATEFVEGDWNFINNIGPRSHDLSKDSLETAMRLSISPVNPHFRDIKFDGCDFSGRFDNLNIRISFKDCSFKNCDFGLSSWSGTKFTNCEFTRASFSQTSFHNCEFINCHWDKIGYSGTETSLKGSFISNPTAFINAKWINLDQSFIEQYRSKAVGFATKHRSQKLYSLAKHEASKEVIARLILNNSRTVGDERTFYEAGRLHALQVIKRSISHDKERLASSNFLLKPRFALRILSAFVERGFIWFLGFTNKWGASTIRPLMMLVLIFCGFAIIYHLGFGENTNASIAKSFEISSIAGYTRGAAVASSRLLRLTEWLNLGSAITVYTILFATITSRICKVR